MVVPIFKSTSLLLWQCLESQTKIIENLRFLFSDDVWKWKLASKRLSCEGTEAAAVNKWERGRNY